MAGFSYESAPNLGIQQAAEQDPTVQAAARQLGAALRSGNRAGLYSAQQQFQRASGDFLTRVGLDPGQYELQPHNDGTFTFQERSWMDKHGKQVAAATMIGGGALVGAGALGAFGSGAGGAASSAPMTAVDGTAMASTAVPAAAGAGTGTAAGTVAGSAAGGALGLGLKYGVPIAGSFLQSYYGNKSQQEQAKRNTALEESALDPFRQQTAQANAMSNLDWQERRSYKPLSYNGGQLSGSGYSYERSPEVTEGLGALKRDVMAGHTVPTMTDPANYGKTATLNLLDPKRRRLMNGDEYQPSFLGA